MEMSTLRKTFDPLGKCSEHNPCAEISCSHTEMNWDNANMM